MRMIADHFPYSLCQIVGHCVDLPHFEFTRTIWQDEPAMEHPEQGRRSKPVIILVEPQLGENIGMVARAMANFGLAELRLVNPRDGWPNDKARAAASKADHVIDGGRGVRRPRGGDRRPQFRLCHHGAASATASSRCARPSRRRGRCAARGRGGERTGILFGRERFGLFNEEMALADEIVTFPVNPAFASLNIAQAVLLMSYEWMKSGLEAETQTAFRRSAEHEPAEKEHLHGLLGHLEEALIGARLFPPGREEAEDGRQSRAVLTRAGLQRSRDQGAARRLASLDYFSPNEPRGTGYPARKARDAKLHGEDDGPRQRNCAGGEERR